MNALEWAGLCGLALREQLQVCALEASAGIDLMCLMKQRRFSQVKLKNGLRIIGREVVFKTYNYTKLYTGIQIISAPLMVNWA